MLEDSSDFEPGYVENDGHISNPRAEQGAASRPLQSLLYAVRPLSLDWRAAQPRTEGGRGCGRVARAAKHRGGDARAAGAEERAASTKGADGGQHARA